jgi:hypothetical protein
MEKLMFAAVVLSLYWNTGTDFSTLNVPVLSSLLFLMVLSPMCSAIIYLPGASAACPWGGGAVGVVGPLGVQRYWVSWL